MATGGNFTLYDNLQVEVPSGSIGTNYCSAASNSTGGPAVISAVEAPQPEQLPRADLREMPNSQFSYFICGQASGFIAGPGGSGQPLHPRPTGALPEPDPEHRHDRFSVDHGRPDLDPRDPVVAVQPGDTWFFQAWYRDNNPTPTSNFSDGIQIDFQ